MIYGGNRTLRAQRRKGNLYLLLLLLWPPNSCNIMATSGQSYTLFQIPQSFPWQISLVKRWNTSDTWECFSSQCCPYVWLDDPLFLAARYLREVSAEGARCPASSFRLLQSKLKNYWLKFWIQKSEKTSILIPRHLFNFCPSEILIGYRVYWNLETDRERKKSKYGLVVCENLKHKPAALQKRKAHYNWMCITLSQFSLSS